MGEAVKKEQEEEEEEALLPPFLPMAKQDAKIENFHFKTLLYSWRSKVIGIEVDENP